MTCVLIGDSLAVGVAGAMPACQVQAKSGITSTGYLHRFATHVSADLAVISLGANDWHLPTYDNLRTLRGAITAGRVIWLLPHIKRCGVRDSILRAAAEAGDSVIDTAPYAGSDGVHPTGAGYRHIAAMANAQNTPNAIEALP